MSKLHLAILGVGLIGGAFGMALKDKMGDDIFITGNTRTQKSIDNTQQKKRNNINYLFLFNC